MDDRGRTISGFWGVVPHTQNGDRRQGRRVQNERFRNIMKWRHENWKIGGYVQNGKTYGPYESQWVMKDLNDMVYESSYGKLKFSEYSDKVATRDLIVRDLYQAALSAAMAIDGYAIIVGAQSGHMSAPTAELCDDRYSRDFPSLTNRKPVVDFTEGISSNKYSIYRKKQLEFFSKTSFIPTPYQLPLVSTGTIYREEYDMSFFRFQNGRPSRVE